MPAKIYDTTSTVESVVLKRSGRKLMYAPTEKMGIIEAENFPMLGKTVALRFVEWAGKNPGGVISLPTGKTPEMFIKWTGRILTRWETPEIKELLDEFGIDASRKPDMKSLSFVQIDEFYPIDAHQRNSFNFYVNKFYINGFGLDPKKALLINATSLGLPPGSASTLDDLFPGNLVDLSLRVRQTRTRLEEMQKQAINRVDMFCMEYESRVREMGGIGFFLGGSGPTAISPSTCAGQACFR